MAGSTIERPAPTSTPPHKGRGKSRLGLGADGTSKPDSVTTIRRTNEGSDRSRIVIVGTSSLESHCQGGVTRSVCDLPDCDCAIVCLPLSEVEHLVAGL